jgi:hypothetical protein
MRVFIFLQVFKSLLFAPIFLRFLLRFFGTFFSEGANEYPGRHLVINWRAAVNKKGLYAIHLRVYIHPDRSRYYLSKCRKSGLEQWTGKDGSWLKNTHPFAFEINNRIAELKARSVS